MSVFHCQATNQQQLHHFFPQLKRIITRTVSGFMKVEAAGNQEKMIVFGSSSHYAQFMQLPIIGRDIGQFRYSTTSSCGGAGRL